jgi:hypothetical protein
MQVWSGLPGVQAQDQKPLETLVEHYPYPALYG